MARKPGRLTALAVLVIGLTIFAQSQAGQSALRRLGLVGSPQRYTELAFVGAQHLPTQVPHATASERVRFTITNHEGRTRRYGWTIGVGMGSSQTRQLATGQTSLRDGRQALLDPEVTFGCAAAEASVEVRLSSGEVVDFLVQCAGPLSNVEVLQRSLSELVARWRPSAKGGR